MERSYKYHHQFITAVLLAAVPVVGAQSVATDREAAMDWMLKSYQPRVESALTRVVHYAPAWAKTELNYANLDFSSAEVPFVFYADSADTKTVHVSLGGLSTLETSAVALAFSVQDLEDNGWWLQYMLYHRALRRRPNTVWVEPFDAAGLSLCDQSKKTALSSQELLDGMIVFVVAHEAGHVALKHDGRPLPGESASEYLIRRQGQEAAADRFALDMIGPLGIDIYAPSVTLITHLVIFGNSASLISSPHSGDDERLQQVASYYASRPGEAGANIVTLAEGFSKLLGKDGGADAGYAVLDKEADSITLESLKRKSHSTPDKSCLDLLDSLTHGEHKN